MEAPGHSTGESIAARLNNKYADIFEEVEEKHFDNMIEDKIQGKITLSPFLPSQERNISKLLEIAGITGNDVILDAGCGDGRVLVCASVITGCKGIGIDVSQECLDVAAMISKEEKVDHLITLHQADATTLELPELPITSQEITSDQKGPIGPNVVDLLPKVTVLYLYVYPTLLTRLRSLAQWVIGNGGKVVTTAYHFPDWEPELEDLDFKMRLLTTLES
mmetsp:Transcript_5014/g.7610  ORF Transcript_5014/g.7610 Transcript_5014/m.7610 type:complete len:220 (-) Transcript_5014:57-716(-)|eukprot:CAMPEP_0113940132 /NCGR_PEP_ID=MMETSP1339-20121228/6309_1 /TAXON_ID=94617 /ORGANISM="Fibrocapsa japonica" /LENGTH=219 /DNA_ID=CAMNT_0000943835 /DNA_START=139 /DNA_END=798 /DNA_ORIENTATION=+ /assembly_acc=CAM_ASM_000762